MKAVWVFGNNDWDDNFKFGKIELMSAFTSVIMWKHFYPTDVTFLYCDESIKKYFTKIGLLDIWDIVDTSYLQEQDVYNRKAFWTIDKNRILGHMDSEFIFIDLDFYIKKKLPDFTKFDIVTAFEENTIGYYMNCYDKDFYHINIPESKHFKNTAYNTCFYYVKYPEISKIHAEVTLKGIKLINNIENVNGSHNIFMDQYVLAALSNFNKWNYSPLCNQQYIPKNNTYDDIMDRGFFTYQESNDYYRHLGIEKRFDINDIRSLKIQSEILTLLKTHEPNTLKQLFNIINENN